MSEKKEKTGIYISFKKSEKTLYEDIKNIDNYSQLIKDLLSNHLYGTPIKQSVTSEENKISVGVDDICRIIESATKHLGNSQNMRSPIEQITEQGNSSEEDIKTKTQDTSVNNGYSCLENNDLDDEIINNL